MCHFVLTANVTCEFAQHNRMSIRYWLLLLSLLLLLLHYEGYLALYTFETKHVSSV
jgi:hypothetical protein